MPPQDTLRHSKAGLAQSLVESLLLSLGPAVHKILFATSEDLWRVWGLTLNVIVSLLPSCWGFSFVLGRGIFFW